MQHSLSNRRTWLWLTLLLLLFILISYFLLSGKPKDYPNFVSNSPSPTGVKAIYTYLEDHNSSVERWSHSPTYLGEGRERQLLIMVEPFFIPEQEDMETYEKFMEAGNTILLFKGNPDGMFGLKTVFIEEVPPSSEKIYNNDEKEYSAEVTSAVRLQTNEEDEVLLYDEEGTLALKRSIGNGELIVSNSPEWMTNDVIVNDDHIPLVLSLINEESPSTIMFEEYSHGGQNASTILTLYPKWLLVLLIQGIVLTILWLWYQGKRFGPIFIPREETVRFSDERVKALAAWYLKGRRYNDSLAIQADYVKLVMQERWGIPYGKDWGDITDQLGRSWKHMPSGEIRAFIDGLTNILKKEKVSKQEFLLWSKRMDRLRKEVEEG